MAATWAYQDCEKSLAMSAKWAANNKLLRELVEKVKKRVAAKEEELKANEVELVAQAEELGKIRAKFAQLEGELARSRDAAAEDPASRAQLEAAQDQARTIAALVVSEFLTSEEMAKAKDAS